MQVQFKICEIQIKTCKFRIKLLYLIVYEKI